MTFLANESKYVGEGMCTLTPNWHCFSVILWHMLQYVRLIHVATKQVLQANGCSAINLKHALYQPIGIHRHSPTDRCAHMVRHIGTRVQLIPACLETKNNHSPGLSSLGGFGSN